MQSPGGHSNSDDVDGNDYSEQVSPCTAGRGSWCLSRGTVGQLSSVGVADGVGEGKQSLSLHSAPVSS